MLIAQARPIDYDKAVATAKKKAPDMPTVLLAKYGVRKLWDNYEIIADVPTDDAHFLRIAAGTLNGFRQVIIHEFYFNKQEGTWKPGKKGMQIPMLVPFYACDDVYAIRDVGTEFLEKFTQAVNTAQSMPLADSDNAMYILRNYTKSTTIKSKEISK